MDNDYIGWIKELSSRYRRSQVKAATKVNVEMLRFYWELWRDITKRDAENKYGNNFYGMLSTDLKKALPGVDGLSPSNIRYSKRFYLLYSPILENLQQAAGKLPEAPEQPKVQQAAGKLLDENLPQVVEELFSVPWGHHRLICLQGSRTAHRKEMISYIAALQPWLRFPWINLALWQAVKP